MEAEDPLETGYGPDTPRGDNACNDYAQGLVEAYGSLASARGDRVAEGADLFCTDATSLWSFGNVVIVRRPLPEDRWRAAVAQMHSFYREGPGGPFLVFSAWPTPDLANMGFTLVGHPPLMYRLPEAVALAPIEGFEIRSVDDGSASDWEEALVDGFPVPELQPFRPGCMLPPPALSAEGWRHWVGYLDGEPVGTASAYLGSHHIDVEFISTMERARRRGIGRALTATATLAVPDRPAMLISSDLGRPVYQRLGYRAILRFTLWEGARRS